VWLSTGSSIALVTSPSTAARSPRYMLIAAPAGRRRIALAAKPGPLLRVFPPAAVLTAASIRCCTWTHVRHP
jgi:hypothetical protein